MSEWRNNRIEELNNQLNSADSRIAEYRNELNKLESVRLQIIGALTVLDEESKSETSKAEAAK